MCSDSSRLATKTSVKTVLHHLSHDNSAYAGLDISSTCRPPSLYERFTTLIQTSMVGKDHMVADSSKHALHSASLNTTIATQMFFESSRCNYSFVHGQPTLESAVLLGHGQASKSSNSTITHAHSHSITFSST